ncbi:MAG TPA: hypothetical protein EYP16_01335 [Candidatus Atribacteria bacterium]|nr:hypothetical protein [Candidatus Atribacteria bacterium]
MAKIAVATMNPRLYYKIVKALRNFNISFISVLPQEDLPKEIKVVLTSSFESSIVNHQNKIIVSEDNINEALFKAICAIKNKKHFNQLIFGIDPGATYGLVVLADGELISHKLFKNIENLISYINLFSSFPSKMLVIKIGTGSKKYLKKFLMAIKSISLSNFKLELVDERSSIPFFVKDFNFQSDIKSAYGIALSRGRLLKVVEGFKDEDVVI